MTVQNRNAAMVTLLETDFIRRNEPGNLLGNIISTYQALPGLRGFWPFSSVDENSDIYDITGQGRTLTNTNTVTFNNTDFLPYAEFDGATNYLTRSDEAGLDITGDLTLGCWVYLNALTSGGQITKFSASTGQRSFQLRFAAGSSTFTFTVTTDGTTNVSIISSIIPVINTWYFVGGRFTPSTEISTFVSGTKTTLSVGVPATIFNGNLPLVIGARSASGNILDGNIALPFLCAYSLPDNMITNLYQQSRVLFGV